MKIDIASRSGASIATVTLDDKATVGDLKKEFARIKPKYYPARQRFTVDDEKKTPLEDSKKLLSEYGILKDGSRLLFKDLGAQLSFRSVFLVEYAGPLFLYPLVALFLTGGDLSLLNMTQQVALFLWVVHFTKRELETIFVHEFGDLTMPVRNIFKNSIYYWGFGLAVAIEMNQVGRYQPSSIHLYIGFLWFCISMLGNFICHIQLMMLREPGSSELKLPRGGLFELVTAPNYFCEISTWVGFNILVGLNFTGILFNLVGAWQMRQWALDKHRRYKKLFPNYPKSRKVLVPFIY